MNKVIITLLSLSVFLVLVSPLYANKGLDAYLLRTQEKNQKAIMIVGSGHKYSRGSLNVGDYFHVDSNEKTLPDLIQNIRNPLPKDFENKFDVVEFERLPSFVIGETSIKNAWNVLKPGGKLVFLASFPTCKFRKNTDDLEEVPNLKNDRKIYFDSLSKAFVLMSSSERAGENCNRIFAYDEDALTSINYLKNKFFHDLNLQGEPIISLSGDDNHAKFEKDFCFSDISKCNKDLIFVVTKG